jgi:hypothetical protein
VCPRQVAGWLLLGVAGGILLAGLPLELAAIGIAAAGWGVSRIR